MNKEENNNHILIEVLNNDGDLKFTKFRNPQEIWQNNEYPDEYVFRDVDIVNVFKLIQENKQLKEENQQLKERITKAIEVLEQDGNEYTCVDYMCEAIWILKGDSNE